MTICAQAQQYQVEAGPRRVKEGTQFGGVGPRRCLWFYLAAHLTLPGGQLLTVDLTADDTIAKIPGNLAARPWYDEE